MISQSRKTAPVLQTSIDVLSWELALSQISTWSANHESRYVCICNAHSVVTAGQDAAFGRVLFESDMATPDGAPVAWIIRKLGFQGQQRINGPDLMWKYFELAAQRSESIYLYGATLETLALLEIRLAHEFPGLKIAGSFSPPFRAITPEEDLSFVADINASGAGTVWVSLGCPKQEKWMAAHRGHINAVMIGVGAAFDFHAGSIQRAPVWMRNHGFEWLHRLFSEPRRLWRRYLITNSVFLFGAFWQLIFRRRSLSHIERMSGREEF